MPITYLLGELMFFSELARGGVHFSSEDHGHVLDVVVAGLLGDIFEGEIGVDEQVFGVANLNTLDFFVN